MSGRKYIDPALLREAVRERLAADVRGAELPVPLVDRPFDPPTITKVDFDEAKLDPRLPDAPERPTRGGSRARLLDGYLRAAEAAARVGISQQRLAHHARLGRIAFVVVDAFRAYRIADLDAFVARGRR